MSSLPLRPSGCGTRGHCRPRPYADGAGYSMGGRGGRVGSYSMRGLAQGASPSPNQLAPVLLVQLHAEPLGRDARPHPARPLPAAPCTGLGSRTPALEGRAGLGWSVSSCVTKAGCGLAILRQRRPRIGLVIQGANGASASLIRARLPVAPPLTPGWTLAFPRLRRQARVRSPAPGPPPGTACAAARPPASPAGTRHR